MVPVAGSTDGIVRHRAADQIFAALRARIVTGDLARGVRLPAERELAERYRVSVPTVREAIRALAATGLVDVRHGAGTFVAADADRVLALHLVTFLQLEAVELVDAVNLLRVLDRQAAVQAATAATAEDIAALRAAVAGIDAAAGTVATIADAVTVFLAAVAAASHDRLLGAIARFLIELVVRLEMDGYGDRPAGFWRDWVSRLQPFRVALVDAIAAGDVPATEVAADAYHAAVARQVAENPRLREMRFSDGAVVELLADRA